jgi:outer membrane protein OmpA-like peptidoglycan-associated protein/opacity protein-like surface antigen
MCTRLLPAEAQERRYLFEVGAAGAYQSFGDVTQLDGSAGGLARVGIWLPLNISIEAEGSLAKPNSISVKTGAVSALYNLLLGSKTWGYLKAGYGGTKYGGSGSDCQKQEFVGKICGTTSTFLAGLGVRIPFSQMVLLRAEGLIYPNKGSTVVAGSDPPDTNNVNFSNFGLNLGLSLMLGSKPIPDSDGDGVLNNRDRCANTPAGAVVNDLGCPSDSDGDGVADGIDKCPNTAVGAIVDAAGCTRDSDGDNIPDGVDKCPDSPAGVLVDSNGCPKDSDGDGIPDGADRCSATPRGATVDALGCPGDEDADGVLDGLDKCPRTPIGATVNSSGCAPSQQQIRQPAKPAPADTSAGPPPSRPSPSPSPSPGRPAGAAALAAGAAMVLEGVTFESGSARLQSGSYVELDSIAKVLLANPKMKIEIAGHTDNAGTPADNQHLSTLRAEAVRNYFVAKGVPFQQMVARGYGATMPRTPDTTPQGRAANRRVEIRQLPPGE